MRVVPRTRTAAATAASEATREKRREALELRKRGLSYEAIAEQMTLKGGRSTARKLVVAALADITAEPAEEVKKLELERLDGLYSRALAIADDSAGFETEAGTLALEIDAKTRVSALQAAIKVQERRARLVGLDAPVKVQEIQPDKLTDEQLAAELEKALAALRKGAA